MRVEFTKMHGTGNDFVVIENLHDGVELEPEAVARLCDRHTGIGADGLILVRSGPDTGTYFMDYRNADGSLAEMCGNGIRCLARFLADRGLFEGDSVTVHTLGGPKHVRVARDQAGVFVHATVDMGAPEFEPSKIPVDADADYVHDCPVDTPIGEFRITAVSMGNPHAIIFVDDVSRAPVEVIGPFLESHDMFPHKTNVEFAHVLPGDIMDLRVWERGVGETLACGTGACAATVAASFSCLIGREALVRLPGGELVTRWDEDDHVFLTGAAENVFQGSVDI